MICFERHGRGAMGRSVPSPTAPSTLRQRRGDPSPACRAVRRSVGRTTATSQSQSTDSSIAFLSRPAFRLLNVVCGVEEASRWLGDCCKCELRGAERISSPVTSPGERVASGSADLASLIILNALDADLPATHTVSTSASGVDQDPNALIRYAFIQSSAIATRAVAKLLRPGRVDFHTSKLSTLTHGESTRFPRGPVKSMMAVWLAATQRRGS